MADRPSAEDRVSNPLDMRKERINRGFSIRALARELGIPEQTIRRAEDGQAPSIANAHKLANFYGVKVTDIWGVDSWDRTEAAA
jgi:transcriptional regulator with XRE-family HTH domain